MFSSRWSVNSPQAAADVLERLRTPAIPLAPGTVSAATAHLEAVAKRLDLVNRQMLAVDERLDYLTHSLDPCQTRHDAKFLARAIRAHWGIENRAHYVRDVTLGGDGSRIRVRPGVMARIRSVALNILRATGVQNISQALYAPGKGSGSRLWRPTARSIS